MVALWLCEQVTHLGPELEHMCTCGIHGGSRGAPAGPLWSQKDCRRMRSGGLLGQYLPYGLSHSSSAAQCRFPPRTSPSRYWVPESGWRFQARL